MTKWITVYNEMNKPAKAAIWITFCSVFQKGIQFLVIPLYIRMMSTEQYGQYAVFLTYYDFISIFATLNLSYQVADNGMVRYEDKKDEFIAAMQGLGICVSMLLFCLYLPVMSWWWTLTHLSFGIMLAMFVEFIMKLAYELWCKRLWFDYCYRPVVCLTVILSIVIPGISIPLILCSSDKGMSAIYGRVWGSVLVFLIPFFLILKKSRKLFNFSYWKFGLKFNIPLLPHFLSSMILNQTDRLMINYICGSSSAGIYSLAYSVSVVTQILNTAVNSSFVPYTYKSLKSRSYESIKNIANQLVLLIAGIDLALVLTGPELIKILGTEEYYKAKYVIPSVAISMLFVFIYNLFVNIEYFYNENKFVPITSVIAAVLNIILNRIFITRYGFIAAGYTTLATYILYAIGHFVFMCRSCKKYLNGNKVYDYSFIWKVSAIATAASFLILALYDYWYIRYGIIMIGLAFCIKNRRKIIKLVRINSNT